LKEEDPMSVAAMTVESEPRWRVPGDWNGFFGLFTNGLLNVIVITGLCLDVVKLPEDIVFDRILPALGIALPLGNLYYAYLACRLANKEGRGTVTAMPYGPSVPHMFIVVFLIMLPIYLKTNDPLLAWQAGLAWCLVIGVIVLLGAFVGPTVRKYTPRGDARHARRHIDRLHFDAASLPGLGSGAAVLPVAGDRADQLDRQRPAAGRPARRIGRGGGRHGAGLGRDRARPDQFDAW
jgi:hypothetical protein